MTTFLNTFTIINKLSDKTKVRNIGNTKMKRQGKIEHPWKLQ